MGMGGLGECSSRKSCGKASGPAVVRAPEEKGAMSG